MLYDFFLKNLFIFIVIIFIIIFLFFLETFYFKKFRYAVKIVDLLESVNHDRAIVLDLRTAVDYKKCHILNSINLPFDIIGNNLNFFKKYKNKKVILVCTNNSESLKAFNSLKKKLDVDLYFLDGGFNSWLKEGMPTTSL